MKKIKSLFRKLLKRKEPIEDIMWPFRTSPARVVMILTVVMTGGSCRSLEDGWVRLKTDEGTLDIHPSGKGAEVFKNGKRDLLVYTVRDFWHILRPPHVQGRACDE